MAKSSQSYPKSGEGSRADIAEDTRQARRAGQSLKNYERSAADKRADKKEAAGKRSR